MAYLGWPGASASVPLPQASLSLPSTSGPYVVNTGVGTSPWSSMNATSNGMVINGNLTVTGTIKQNSQPSFIKGKTIEFEMVKHGFLNNHSDHEFVKSDKHYKLLVDSGYLDTSKEDLTALESYALGGTVLCLCYDTDYDILELCKLKHPNHKVTYKQYLYKDNFMINNNADLSELTDEGNPVIHLSCGLIPSIPSVVAHLSGILNKDYSSKLRLYYANNESDSKFVTIYDKTLLRDAQRKFCGMYSYLKLKSKEEVYNLTCKYFNSDKTSIPLTEFVSSICIPGTKIHPEFISELETQLSLNVRVKDISTCASITLTNLLFSNLDHV